jgi:hypothetical protein
VRLFLAGACLVIFSYTAVKAGAPWAGVLGLPGALGFAVAALEFRARRITVADGRLAVSSWFGTRAIDLSSIVRTVAEKDPRYPWLFAGIEIQTFKGWTPIDIRFLTSDDQHRLLGTTELRFELSDGA